MPSGATASDSSDTGHALVVFDRRRAVVEIAAIGGYRVASGAMSLGDVRGFIQYFP